MLDMFVHMLPSRCWHSIISCTVTILKGLRLTTPAIDDALSLKQALGPGIGDQWNGVGARTDLL